LHAAHKKPRALAGAICIAALAVLSPVAARAQNPTNTVWLHADDVSVNPLTLSLRWKNARIQERIPVLRDALVLQRGDIAISLWRVLLLQTVYFRTFDVRGVDVRLVRHADGRLSPFHSADPTNLTIAVASGVTNRFGRSDATKPRMKKAVRLDADDDDATPFVVPLLIVTNLNITCDDHESGARLWSLDDMYFALERFRTPVLENRQIWRMALGAGCDGEPGRWFRFGSDLQTSGGAPWARFTFAAARLRLHEPWLDAFTESQTATTSLTARAETHAGWFEHCYSNAWRTLWRALDAAGDETAADPLISNYFVRAGASNVEFNAWVDIVFSNRQLAPGVVDLHFNAPQPARDCLRITFDITNVPPWVVRRKR